MAARLKVYATRIGFHDVVVAAANQKAALAAWDVRENLFASGAATTTEDEEAVSAAVRQPGVVLSRPAGQTTGAFTAEAQTPAQAPTVARPKKMATAAAGAGPAPAPPPPPDRTALTAAERALDAIDAEERRALEEIAQARKALDTREAALRREIATRRRQLERDRDRARTAYQRAGGR